MWMVLITFDSDILIVDYSANFQNNHTMVSNGYRIKLLCNVGSFLQKNIIQRYFISLYYVKDRNLDGIHIEYT